MVELDDYYSVDLHINSTGIFNSDNDTVVTDLSGATTYIFTGLTANTEYYIRTTPYISAGFLQ
jgi:hypothetical protein